MAALGTLAAWIGPGDSQRLDRLHHHLELRRDGLGFVYRGAAEHGNCARLYRAGAHLADAIFVSVWRDDVNVRRYRAGPARAVLRSDALGHLLGAGLSRRSLGSGAASRLA